MKSKRLILEFLSLLFNWLTNNLVYYGISFNTSELAGDPYLNFTLSALVEIFAIFMCHVTLDKFGRKIPYVINMLTAGIALLCVLFVPESNFFY
jgi:OCT family organic cation transporter-like MFS transporter 4/5